MPDGKSVTEDSRPHRGLDGHDRRKLRAAVRAVTDARHLRRVQAVLLFCQRRPLKLICAATGHRVLRRARSTRQGEVHAFLRELRSRYRAAGRIWLVLDRHGSHDSPATHKLAAALRIELLLLSKQWPELNPMDHLWKEAKAAEHWLLWLTPTEARRKAGMMSKNFWLLT